MERSAKCRMSIVLIFESKPLIDKRKIKHTGKHSQFVAIANHLFQVKKKNHKNTEMLNDATG